MVNYKITSYILYILLVCQSQSQDVGLFLFVFIKEIKTKRYLFMYQTHTPIIADHLRYILYIVSYALYAIQVLFTRLQY